MSPFQRIICLTEESVEILFDLNLEKLIKGVSVYAKRPPQVNSLPKVCHFINAKTQEIVDLRPDLVLGFSDLQKDVAKDLIGQGLNVWISNHRSLAEIFNYIQALSNLVGEEARGRAYIHELNEKIHQTKMRVSKGNYRPRAYFEEWDGPYFSGIQWVSELMQLCGFEDIFQDRAAGKMALEREVKSAEVITRDPEIIFSCWCGKKMNQASIYSREGWSEVSALKNKRVFELAPEIFLQPGPAPVKAGIDILLTYFDSFQL